MNIFKSLGLASKAASRTFKNAMSKSTKDDIYRQYAQLGFQRGEAYRQQRKAQNAYYPGAEMDRHRQDWLTNICTSTSLLRRSIKTLIARSEYAYRTEPYARRAVDILNTFVVGSGLRPFPMVKLNIGTPVDSINNKLASDWERFNDEGMRIGSQQLTMYEAQGLEFVTTVTCGSFLRQIIKSRPGSWLPYSFNIIKAHRLDFSHDDYYDQTGYNDLIAQGKPITVLGQILNAYSEPSGFWLEGESKPRSSETTSIHYRPLEAEQYLGIPWLTPSLDKIWDTQQLSEDKLIQSRILTQMGVWGKRKDKAAIDSILETDSNGDSSVPFDKAMMFYSEEKPEAIQFDDKISESYGPLVRMNLHAIAIGAGFSYQLLSSDLEGANFSGSRTNTIIDSKVFKKLYKSFYKMSCQPAWNKFVEWEVLTGKIPGLSYDQYLRDKWYYNQCYWLPEGEQWVDPLKDAQAQKLMYQTGQITLQEICALRGKNYKSVIRQRQSEKKELQKAGLSELLPTFDGAMPVENVIENTNTQNQDNSINVLEGEEL